MGVEWSRGGHDKWKGDAGWAGVVADQERGTQVPFVACMRWEEARRDREAKKNIAEVS